MFPKELTKLSPVHASRAVLLTKELKIFGARSECWRLFWKSDLLTVLPSTIGTCSDLTLIQEGGQACEVDWFPIEEADVVFVLELRVEMLQKNLQINSRLRSCLHVVVLKFYGSEMSESLWSQSSLGNIFGALRYWKKIQIFVNVDFRIRTVGYFTVKLFKYRPYNSGKVIAA